MTILAKPFYMIRHGETEANQQRIMAGSLDSPLTQKGRDQARDAQRIIEALPDKPSFIVHSNLSRARDTASIINKNMGLSMQEDADIAELHAGDWEGVPYEQCDELFHGWVDPPNGETIAQFFARIKRAKNNVLGQEAKTPPLIVCHGGVFRAFAKIYNIETWGVQNCELHEFMPASDNQDFPWEVTRYYLEGDVIQTVKSASFHNPQPYPPHHELHKKS